MTLFEIIAIAIGLSMDAFAVAVCMGVSMQGFRPKYAFIIALYFGFFQALMPALGFFAGNLFVGRIIYLGNIIAAGILVVLGAKMIYGAIKKSENPNFDGIGFGIMLPAALATSLDALAVGVSFALVGIAPVPAVLIIGIITFALSFCAVKIGALFGLKFKTVAEISRRHISAISLAARPRAFAVLLVLKSVT